MTNKNRGVYVISVAAEMAGVHPQTLRTYERKGLLKPSRTSGGTRRYSDRDVHRVQLIQDLTRREGINLAGVEHILTLQDRINELEKQLEQTRQATQKVRAQARQSLREARSRSGTELVAYRAAPIERYANPMKPTGRRA